MSEIAEAEARIRQLHAHYTDAVWRRDPVAFADCFMPDAEWRIAGLVMRGRDEIDAGFSGFLGTANRVLIIYQSSLLEVSGGTAIGQIYITEQCSWTDRPAHTNLGRYYERYVDCGDRWRFSWRLYQLFYKGPPDLSGTYYDHPDFGPWPAMPPLDAVPPAVRS